MNDFYVATVLLGNKPYHVGNISVLNDATFVSTKHFWVVSLKKLPNLPCQCPTAYFFAAAADDACFEFLLSPGAG